jgi:hypothetical protein
LRAERPSDTFYGPVPELGGVLLVLRGGGVFPFGKGAGWQGWSPRDSVEANLCQFNGYGP